MTSVDFYNALATRQCTNHWFCSDQRCFYNDLASRQCTNHWFYNWLVLFLQWISITATHKSLILRGLSLFVWWTCITTIHISLMSHWQASPEQQISPYWFLPPLFLHVALPGEGGVYCFGPVPSWPILHERLISSPMWIGDDSILTLSDSAGATRPRPWPQNDVASRQYTDHCI